MVSTFFSRSRLGSAMLLGSALVLVFGACSSGQREFAAKGADGGDADGQGGTAPISSAAGGKSAQGGDASQATSGHAAVGGEPSESLAGAGGTLSAGGEGSVPAEGGAPATGKAALGAPCEAGDDCSSTHCADGVCCDAACDSPCEACSAEGACDVTPQDDEACGSITCPTDTACRDYQASIVTERCAGLGQCKTQADCVMNVKNERLSCDATGKICNSSGDCAYPSVDCGATTDCAIGPKFCCAQTDKSLLTCLNDGLNCAQGPDPAASDTGMPVECDGTTDCGPGSVCCWHSGKGSSSISCKTLQTCVPNDNQFYFEAPVCKSDGEESACASGACTGNVSGVPGWKYCQ